MTEHAPAPIGPTTSHGLHLDAVPTGEGFQTMDADPGERTLRAGPVEVRPGELLALARGRVLVLSVQEFRLLTVLVGHKDRVVTRDALYRAVWGSSRRDDDRSVDVYVRKLRVKLAEALPDFVCIHTHVGFGYRFHPERSRVFHTTATPR